MPETLSIEFLRTCTGKRAGSLADVHPIDLGVHDIKPLVSRNAILAQDDDDVIMGTIDEMGLQAGNFARFCLQAMCEGGGVANVAIIERL